MKSPNHHAWQTVVPVLFMLFMAIHAEPVNVALNKQITAEITCGTDGPEEFFPLSMEFIPPMNRVTQTCVNTTTYPAENIVDGDSDTWWQSMSRNRLLANGFGSTDTSPDAVIILDLEQSFEVLRITIRMADAKRPRRMRLSKSEDGVNYQNWAYRLTEESDCIFVFFTPVVSAPTDLNSVICSEFASPSLQNFERLLFDFSTVPSNLMAWKNTRFLKIEFFRMETTLGPTAFKFHHYAVADIEVLAECVCNGHATDCQRVNDTGPFQCVCGGNTEGVFCEQCEPFYNQQPYAYGQACVECNCHEHSDVCVYDPVVANFSQSLDANGEYNGGGRCIDCQDNTTGVNCEKCVAYNYRPVGVEQTAFNACIPCACDGSGVTTSPVSGLYGDCVMNDDSPLPDGKLPGDCFCKLNVEGSKCDTCKSGYFNLTESNAEGCQACLCNVAGSIGGAEAVCVDDESGQCPCKENVMNRQCDECMDGFYNLNQINELGCVPCDCDAGGSIHGVCNKTSGQCLCRDSISGRTCDGTVAGFYVPDLHFMYGEFEHIYDWATWDRAEEGYLGFGYALAGPNNTGTTEVLLPGDTQLSGDMYVLIRYRTEQLTQADITITDIGGDVFRSTASLAECPDAWCYAQTEADFSFTMGQVISIEVSLTEDVLLDRAVVLPVEFVNTSSLFGEEESALFHSRCDVINDIIAKPIKFCGEHEAYCMQHIQSITAYYLDGAEPCGCSNTGAENPETCEAYGGQCDCKSGVTARACDMCQLEYYGLSSMGCQSCNCSTDNKVCDFRTGQCVCPEGTLGRTCDICETNHWNWTSSTGCEACGCSEIGSLSLQCDQDTGVCQCKPGVGGDKCDTCLPGFSDLNVLGCEDCNCNEDGSTGDVCNVTTGQCPCKQYVTGVSCNTCEEGSFYLDVSHEFGCLNCVCMGITNQCAATFWRTKTFNQALYRGSSGAETTEFALYSSARVDLGLDVSVISFNGFNGLEVAISSGTDAYWSAPDLMAGNLLGLYGNMISFQVHYIPQISTGSPRTDAHVLIQGRDNQLLRLPVESIEPETLYLVELKVTHADAIRMDGTSVTREEFLYALSDVAYIMIPASWYTLGHESRLMLLQYHAATSDGLGQTARSVEHCECGPAYQGLSCEKCAEGYRRVNVSGHEFLGECIACECNAHSETCDENTGFCTDCLHNTAGDHCEVCQDGYYGDSTAGTHSDCTQCPCLGPRVVNSSCDVIDDTVTCYCAEGYEGNLCDSCGGFYFGNPEVPLTGTCEACYCHGNSELCDSDTGVCIDCASNTTGDHCERCIGGFYGNASLQNCQVCACDPAGSVNLLCDHATGQCECLEGVGTRTCSECLPNHYGYNNTDFEGCLDCECNEDGSADLQCDEEGICTCQDNAGGDKCDLCSTGFFGLPLHPCQECACDPVGTVDPSLPCEVVTGQCECKHGVGERDCSECDLFYTDFSADGCTLCGTCESSLGNDTMDLQSSWESYWTDAQQVLAMQQEDQYLQSLTNEIEEVLNDLGVSENRLNLLWDTVTQLEDSEPDITAGVNSFIEQAESLVTATESAQNASMVEAERMAEYRECSNNALNNVYQLELSAEDTTQQLSLNNQSAHQLLELSRTMDIGAMNVTYLSELRQVNTELAATELTAASARNMTSHVNDQRNQTLELETAGNLAQTAFIALESATQAASQQVTGVQQVLTGVLEGVDTTVQNRAYGESVMNETRILLDMSEAMQTQNQIDLDQARTWLQEAHTIKEGDEDGDPLPIETDVDISATPSWEQGLDNILNNILAPLDDATNNYNSQVATAEEHAQSIVSNAQQVHAELVYVQPKGQAAVDAIQKYEEVVEVLEESLTLSAEANTTIQQAIQVLETVSLESLKEESAASVVYSEANLTLAQSYNEHNISLAENIAEVNNTLEETIQTWDALWVDLQAFNSNVDLIHARAVDEEFEARLREQSGQVETLTQDINNLATRSETHVAQSTANQNDLNELQEKVTNTSQIMNDIPLRLIAFNTQLSTVQTSVNVSTQRDLEANDIESRIDAKIAEIEAAIQQAQARLEALEQPVSMDTDVFLQMDNPQTGLSLHYNEIQVEFKLNAAIQGIIFFTEKADTSEYLLLQVRDDSLVFAFGNIDREVLVESPAELCPGCWFRVLATRYGLDVKLSVTKLSTGGVATSTGTLQSSFHTTLELNSPLYVGGVPDDAYFRTLSKIDFSQQGLDGCIYNLQFDGVPVPIWQTILHHESDAQCCRKPTINIPTPPTISATSFSGFGYLRLNFTGLEVHTQFQISMQFRSYSPNAVIFLADQENTQTFFALTIDDGRLRMHGYDGIRDVIIGSELFYNTGQWYQVTVLLNSTMAILQTDIVESEDSITQRESISLSHDISLSALEFPHYTIGGQNPNTTNSRGNERKSFAGCIQNVRTSVGSEDPTLVPLSLAEHAGASFEIHMDYCYEEVVSGLRIEDKRGNARLLTSISSINTVQFQFATYEQNGILLLTRLSSAENAYLYVSMYHGEIIVSFDQGSGRQDPLRSRDTNLADGRLHTVKLDFTFHNSPRLTVDGTRHYGALQMSSGMQIGSNPTYLGVTSSVAIFDETRDPVTYSMVGGIKDLTINGQTIDFFDIVHDHDEVYISHAGIPAPLDELPAPPYVTTPAPPTTPRPTCGSSQLFTVAQDGARFGDAQTSYIGYQLSSIQGLSEVLLNSFAVRIEFRALQPDGILLYMSSRAQNPTDYFVIYMHGGYLFASMETGTNSAHTKNISSQESNYDDGNWWTVEVLRLNDFMAIIVDANQDYHNNGGNPSARTRLDIATPIYVGGVPTSVVGNDQLSEEIAANLARSSFHGCIRDVELISHDQNYITLPLDSPNEAEGISQCFDEVSPGVFLNDTRSYVRVESDDQQVFNIRDEFRIDVTFRGITTNGTLVYAYQSEGVFFLVDINDGQICIVMGNRVTTGAPLIVKSTSLNAGYSLCTNQEHTLSILLTDRSLVYDFNLQGWEEWRYPGNYPAPAMFDMRLYAGDVKDASWEFPVPYSQTSFRGCIISVEVNESPYTLADSSDQNVIFAGCPEPQE